MEDLRELKELSAEELKNLYKNNQGFSELVYDLAYEDAMNAQEEQSELMGAKVFKYNDHYNSFYLTTPCYYGVKDGLKVAGALDREYLNDKAARVYDKLCEIKKTYDNLTAEELDERGDGLEEQANNLSDELARIITEDLRAYEDITELDIDAMLGLISDGYALEGFKTDGAKVYEYITKVYK